MRRVVRWRLAAIVICCAWTAVAQAACGGTNPSHRAASSSATQPQSATTATESSPRHVRRRHRPSPGALPQTHQLPSAHTAAFRAEMSALWQAIVTGSGRSALPAFFPERAYAQVKAIAAPAADYRRRLLAEYKLDVAAAHAVLGRGSAQAQLLGVRVPAAYAHWVDPGACYNRVGYYEVPNARVVYRERGTTRSFGIVSMISWRGVWYVVHLGAVTRTGSGGVVDDPGPGPGTSAPSSTC